MGFKVFCKNRSRNKKKKAEGKVKKCRKTKGKTFKARIQN